MQELNSAEIEVVTGGDGVATVAGVAVGVVAGAAIVGTGGFILFAGVLGGAIWEGGYRFLNRRRNFN